MDNIASVAKIRISEAEKESFNEYIENILEYVEILKEVNIDNEVLVNSIENKFGILRNDEVKPSFDVEDLLKNTPCTKDGYFIVPSVLK